MKHRVRENILARLIALYVPFRSHEVLEVILCPIILLTLCGCATSYTLPNGDTRIIGFVAMTVPASTEKKAGTGFRTQNLGLLLYH
jgi:hypothetical protein